MIKYYDRSHALITEQGIVFLSGYHLWVVSSD